MRYILIDPYENRISEHFASGKIDLDLMYRAIECDDVNRVELAPGCDLWVDGEGLINRPHEKRYFSIGDSKQLFAGRGLVCGLSPGGNSIALPDRFGFQLIVNNVIFLGGLADVQQAIGAGRIERPASYFVVAGGARKKIWEFNPETADL